jgi:hypothetical protein
MRGSHKMASIRFQSPSRGGSEEGKKNEGWGERKDIVMIKRFSIATQAW